LKPGRGTSAACGRMPIFLSACLLFKFDFLGISRDA
jgi:hypothetical protein